MQVTTSKLLSITNFLLLWNGKYSSVLKKLYRTNLITHACMHSSHQLNIFWLLQTFLHKAPDSFKLNSTGRNGSLWCDVGSLSFMWEVLGNSRKSWENQKKCQNIRSVSKSGKDSGNENTLLENTGRCWTMWAIQPWTLQPASPTAHPKLSGSLWTRILSDSSPLFTIFLSFFLLQNM